MSRTTSRREKKSKRLRKKRFRYISLAIVFVVILLTTLGIRHYNKLRNPQGLFVPKDKDKFEDELDIDINGQFDRNTINIMMVGFDRDEDRSKTESVFRTDTNILLSINLEKETVDMLSIPRDSYVTIANRGIKEKFNSAFVYGYIDGKEDKTASGYKNLLDTTRNLLGGIPLYYYIGVDMDVVVEIVDAMDGVEIDVPAHVVDKKRGVDIKRGFQKMDGPTLLGYARHRRLRDGDIDRVRNQQEILMAIFNTLKKSNKFKSLPRIYKSMANNIETNMNFNQLSALALFAKDMDRENIRTHMLAGNFGEFNHKSYWIVDQNQRIKLVEELFKVRINPDRQDPLREIAESFYASISNNILAIGEEGTIAAEGVTNINFNKKFEARDMRFASSNDEIATVNGDGIVVGISPGDASISITIDNLTQIIDIKVIGEKEDPDGEENPDKGPGEDPGKDPGEDEDQGKDPGEDEDQGKDPGEGEDPDMDSGGDEESNKDSGQDEDQDHGKDLGGDEKADKGAE